MIAQRPRRGQSSVCEFGSPSHSAAGADAAASHTDRTKTDQRDAMRIDIGSMTLIVGNDEALSRSAQFEAAAASLSDPLATATAAGARVGRTTPTQSLVYCARCCDIA